MVRKEVLRQINLPRHILNHTVGKNHPWWVRIVFGTVIIYLGSLIPEAPFIIKPLGQLVHAIGAIPYLYAMIDFSDPHDKTPEKCVTCPV